MAVTSGFPPQHLVSSAVRYVLHVEAIEHGGIALSFPSNP